MLKIKNLHASVDGKEILKGIDLEINHGTERCRKEYAFCCAYRS